MIGPENFKDHLNAGTVQFVAINLDVLFRKPAVP